LKFTLSIQDGFMDDDIDNILRAVAKQSGKSDAEVYGLLDTFVGAREFVTLQFDTEDNSCRILRVGEDGVNEYVPERDVVATIDRYTPHERWVQETQRQLTEAVDTLSAEKDKTTPFALQMFKLIEDLREKLKTGLLLRDQVFTFPEDDEDEYDWDDEDSDV
jgi:hypothetical protein